MLDHLVKINCVSLISDGNTKKYKVYTGSLHVQAKRAILYSLYRGACSRGLQAGRERELVLGLCVERRGLLEMLISCSEGACVLQSVERRWSVCVYVSLRESLSMRAPLETAPVTPLL